MTRTPEPGISGGAGAGPPRGSHLIEQLEQLASLIRPLSAAGKHAELVPPVLAEARATVNSLMGNPVNERVRYACWRQQLYSMESGPEDLMALSDVR